MMTVWVNWTHNPETELEKTRQPTAVTEVNNFIPEVGETTLSSLLPDHPEHCQADRGYDGKAVVQRRRPEMSGVRGAVVAGGAVGRPSEPPGACNVSRSIKPQWERPGRTILGGDDPIPKVMGIVNLTPDSFSDGGRTRWPRRRRRARRDGWSAREPA